MKGTFYWDLQHSEWPVLCVSSQNGELMLSKAEFGGDYYWSTGRLEPVNNIAQELEALGQFEDWFYKKHKDIYQKIIVETLYTSPAGGNNRYF